MNSIYSDPLIIPVYKPVDWTSYDVVRYLKKALKPQKIGHGGTLDPFAEGLLLILLNKATKRMQDILKLPKTYEATLELGLATDTEDRTGNVVAEMPVPSISVSQIESVFESLTGEIEQKTPLFSARRVKGKRLYRLAREGKSADTPVRKVKIHKISLLDFNGRQIRFMSTVSSGTYIRTLGREIALRLGTDGHLSKLIRTEIGNFRLESAFQIKEIRRCERVMA